MKKIIVIGGGPGGYVAAIRAAQLGAKVTLIEKEHLGGTCLNIGCIPTKCLLHSAELVEQIKTQGKDIGVEVEGVKVNFPQVIAHKNAISKQLTSGVAGLLKLNKVKKVDGKTKMQPAEVYASTVNSVVSINCSAVSTNIFGQRVQSASSGSGFVITQDGYIVTNQHVVSGASSVNVTLYNGDTYPATVVGGDSDYDVAVLKIEATGLQAVTLGKSADVNVGDTVMAIGNPLGELTFSMSQGIVSCCDRAINVDGTPFNMIQVDASINPGNSGGPLMNLYGEVVGIVSAKYSSYSDTTVEGLGFAIPIGDVQAIITDIMENGQITNKPSFGITAGTMTQQMAAQYQIDQTSGAFVYSVNKGGAGEKAGLKMGDVITKVDSTDITSMEDLTAAKKGHKAGDTVTAGQKLGTVGTVGCECAEESHIHVEVKQGEAYLDPAKLPE